MKLYFKLLMTVLLSCLFACKTTAPGSMNGPATADPTHTEPQKTFDNGKMYRLAQCYLNGINTGVDYEKAFADFSYLAGEGDLRAINALAGMYRQGMGVEQDQAKARELYRQASEEGYGKASYNLAQMYKTAQGGEQDFEKAFEYAQTALEQGNNSALYMLGYLYYKGFGTKQDYAQAVRYFTQGVENNQTSSMYFLGLCYLGGYGVEKDIAQGKALIKRAAELGHDHAVEFMADGSISQYAKAENIDPQGKAYPPFGKITGFPVQNLSGDWEGRILQYDYSGKTVMEEQSLKLKISDDNGKLSGIWLQSDSIAMELNATRSVSISASLNNHGAELQAENMQYMKTWDRTYEIRHLNFAMPVEENNDIVLYAVVEQFSPQTVEPSAPTMLELRKAPPSPHEGGDVAGASSSPPSEGLGEAFFRVYPNPFSNELTVEFTAQQAGEYSILLYDLSGKLIKTENINVPVETLRATSLLNTASLPVGTYSVNLRGKGVNISTLVIKNKN